jgi:hypothetical protein
MRINFNKNNFFIALILLFLINLIGPFFINPETETGSLFFFVIAFITALMFPFLKVVDES